MLVLDLEVWTWLGISGVRRKLPRIWKRGPTRIKGRLELETSLMDEEVRLLLRRLDWVERKDSMAWIVLEGFRSIFRKDLSRTDLEIPDKQFKYPITLSLQTSKFGISR